ncbi:MAG: STAS/SEC14 domain-containing protein [Bacteroidota bacterium]
MFRLLSDTPPHVVAFEIDGTTTKPDIELLYRAVERAMGGGNVHLYGEIGGLGGLTLDALGANLGRGLGLLTSLGQIDRYAVVTDVPWIASAARIQGSLLPGLTVRAWPRADAEAALAWASEPLD